MKVKRWSVFLCLIWLSLLIDLYPFNTWALNPSTKAPQPVCGNPGIEKFDGDILKNFKQSTGYKNPTEYRSFMSMVSTVYAVDDTDLFWVLDSYLIQDGIDNDRNGIIDNFSEGMYEIEATCKAVGDHSYVFVENANLSNVSDADVTHVSTEFNKENGIWDTDTEYFGDPTDNDGNEKIIILLFDIRDAYYHGIGNTYVAGYFWSLHQFPTDPRNIFTRYSEYKEIIHIDINPGNERDAGGTIAHEFQHLLHYVADPEENTWVDEGCADYAGYLCGYGHPKSHVSYYLNNPDNDLTSWRGRLEDYGAAYLWTLYLSEQFGGADFIKNLVAEQSHGIEGINNTLKSQGFSHANFKNIFIDYKMANYLDNPEYTKIRGGYVTKLGYDAINLAEYDKSESHGGAAGDTRDGLDLTSELTFSSTVTSNNQNVNQWSSDFFRVHASGSAADVMQIALEGDDPDSDLILALLYRKDDDLFVYYNHLTPDDTRTFNRDFFNIKEPDHWDEIVVCPIRTTRQGTGNYTLTLTDEGIADNYTSISQGSIKRGLSYLMNNGRTTNGAWNDAVPYTGMAALAFLNAGYTQEDEFVSVGIQYLLDNINGNGSISDDYPASYDTSISLLALKAMGNSDFDDKIANAAAYLQSIQSDDSDDSDHPWYGGWGYDAASKNNWSDLYNSQFATMALDAAQVPKEEITWTRFLRFLSRVQNLDEINDMPWADGRTDGGFTYSPHYSRFGDYDSYGSMTAAGLWGLRSGEAAIEDNRVQGALGWLQANEDLTFNSNPLVGNDDRYHYYLSFARAMAVCFLNQDDAGWYHGWYDHLTAKVDSEQNVYGYWNESQGMYEDTSFALLAMQTAQPPSTNLSASFILASPADLAVYDSHDRACSRNECDIPGATFDVNDDGNQVVNLSELEAGRYCLKFHGREDGIVRLKVNGYRSDEIITTVSKEFEIKKYDIWESDVLVSSMAGPLTIGVETPKFIKSEQVGQSEHARICSTLGDNVRTFLPDQDIFEIYGSVGEEVAITVEPDVSGSYTGKRATLSLKKKRRTIQLLEMDLSAPPRTMTVTLPATGRYTVVVAEKSTVANDELFNGDYCIECKSSGKAWETFDVTRWVE